MPSHPDHHRETGAGNNCENYVVIKESKNDCCTCVTQKNKNRPDWDRIYEKSKALSRTSNPIKTPLLALPYGKPPLPSEYTVETVKNRQTCKFFVYICREINLTVSNFHCKPKSPSSYMFVVHTCTYTYKDLEVSKLYCCETSTMHAL